VVGGKWERGGGDGGVKQGRVFGGGKGKVGAGGEKKKTYKKFCRGTIGSKEPQAGKGEGGNGHGGVPSEFFWGRKDNRGRSS